MYNGDKSQSYKEVHEAFVSNLKGTSAGDVFVVLVHLPLAILLLKLVQGSSSSSSSSSRPLFLRDFVYLALPLLLSLTVLADLSYVSAVLLLIGELFTLQMKQQQKSTRLTNTENHPADSNTDLLQQQHTSHNLTFISLFKGGNVLLTCIAILAVDFRVFPRRFAKTETFGLSLMDVGVGTFIFSSAITSRYARGIIIHNHKSKVSSTSSVSISSISSSASSSSNIYRMLQRLAVLLLGVGRMVVTKALGCQEHVTEYGTHWNFFVTLFCIWGAADVAHGLLPRWCMPWLASFILLTYQLLLSQFSLTDYILSAPRNSFLSANREGIFSLCGFLPLYLLSEHLAYRLFFAAKAHVSPEVPQESTPTSPRLRSGNIARLESGRHDTTTTTANNNSNSSNNTNTTYNASAHSSRSSSRSTEDETMSATVFEQVLSTGNGPSSDHSSVKAPHTISVLGLTWRILLPRPCRPLARQLLTLSCSAWSMWWLSSVLVQPASRRLANLSFVFFCLSLFGTLLLLIFLAESVGPRASPAASLEYCNSSQLPVFILANLLTGAINLLLPTLFVAPAPAMLILTAYTACVLGVAWLLGSRRVIS